jgi:hypothetical protein
MKIQSQLLKQKMCDEYLEYNIFIADFLHLTTKKRDLRAF